MVVPSKGTGMDISIGSRCFVALWDIVCFGMFFGVRDDDDAYYANVSMSKG